VDLGLPGVLPVLNVEVVNKAITFGLAVDAHINQRNVFEHCQSLKSITDIVGFLLVD
jgi:Asp-tRNA(Asn)/Glu-tRNA(Gln) amidotransferase B subunit